MTKRISSLLSTGAALAALSFPLAAQEALTPINSDATAAAPVAKPVDTRSLAERLAAFDFYNEELESLRRAESGELESATSTLDSEPSPAIGTSAVFTLPGTFLVGSYNNMNFQYDMFIGEQREFRKIVVDVDVLHNGYPGRVNDDPVNYGTDYYCVFWLNAGSQWPNAIAYLNFLDARGQLENQSNIGGYWSPDTGDYGLRMSAGCPVNFGSTYHIHYEYDAQNRVQGFEMSQGSQTICGTTGFAGESPTVAGNYFFIQFGSQYSPEGPEGATIGWRFSNARIQFIGDEPIPTGRRPRRR